MIEKTKNTIEDYNNKVDLLESLINAIIRNDTLEEVELNYLINFLDYCIKQNEDNLINSLKIQQLFDKFYNYYINNNKNISPKIESIIERKKALLNKSQIDDMPTEEDIIKKDTSLENVTKLDKAAFISTTIILQGSIILTLILSLLALVKK